MSTVDLSAVDLDDQPALTAALGELRRHQPVSRQHTPDGQRWAVTRHADVLQLLRDHATFSSEYGSLLRIRPARDPAAGGMVTLTDPPRHTAIRVRLNRVISDRPVEQLRASVRGIVADLLADATAAGTVDFVSAVADLLPIEVTCDLLGVPAGDRRKLAELSLATFQPEELAGTVDPEALRTTASSEIIEYFIDLAEARQQRPTGDFVSQLVTAEYDGQRLTAQDAALNCLALLLGGMETTRAAAAGGVLLLVEDPRRLDLLRGRPELLGLATEEMVRWVSPIRQVLRMCTADAEIRGVRIAAGEPVSGWLLSANRDEEVFADPEEFVLDRSPNRHLGFGTSDHRCVGRGTARMELRELFAALCRLPYSISLAGPARQTRSPFVSGYASLPVHFTPLN